MLKTPIVFPVLEDDLWELHETFQFWVPGVGLLRVMSGFRFDGLSIPKFAWGIVGHKLEGKGLAGALFHDALYSSKLVHRAIADRVLLYLLRIYAPCIVTDKGWWATLKTAYRRYSWLLKAYTMFGFVRAFGWWPWCRRKISSVRASRKFVSCHSLDKG